AGEEAEFYSLGFDNESLYLLSSSHGRGVDDLIDSIGKKIIKLEKSHPSEDLPLQSGLLPKQNVVSRLAIIGAPNAGKSTLLNRVLGAKRALVSDVPGTTVDPIGGYFDLDFGKNAHLLDKNQIESAWDKKKIFTSDFELKQSKVFEEFGDTDSPLELEKSLEEMYKTVFMDDEALEEKGEILEDEIVEDEIVEENSKESLVNNVRSIHIVDTAGIRQKKKIKSFIESQSVFRSLRCITEADVVIYLMDATKGIGHQDRRLLGIALEKGKSIIMALNKVDLLKEKLKNQKDREKWLQNLRDEIPWLEFCDLVTLSAKEGKGIKRLKRTIQKTIFVRKKTVSTGHLNRFVQFIVDKNPIVVQKARGARFKVKYALMVKNGHPTFLLYSNKSMGIPENYKRYIKNNLRREFDLYNTPVHVIFRSSSDQERGRPKD
ncbi:MAG: GTPase, partial [Bdellovibrionota bacterium]|nr:GTPase [Bdellovibrionota bacterium]